MLATRPLVSTGARSGLLKYNLLSKVLSPNTEAGVRLRKKRKPPSPAMAITTSITATVMPAELRAGSIMTLAGEIKYIQVLTMMQYYIS